MSNLISSFMLGKELTDLLGIKHLTDVSIHFPLNGAVRADVSFFLDDVQAKAVLNLCKDGKWRSPGCMTENPDPKYE